MSGTGPIAIIARREIASRLQNKSFIIGSVITLVILAAVVVLPAIFADDGPADYDVGVVGAGPDGFVAGLENLAAASGASSGDDAATLTVETDLDRAGADRLLRNGDLDAVVDGDELVIHGDVSQELQQWIAQSLVQSSLLDALGEAGVSDDDAIGVLERGASLQIVDLDQGDDDRDEVLGVIAAIALFITVQLGGSGLLSSSIEEKTSRVVEVLLGSVRPRQLLTGKVLGALVVTMIQFSLYVVVGLGLAVTVGDIEFPDATAGTMIIAAVMVLAGFGLYVTFFAVAGAMASGIEDAQSTVGPMMIFMLAGYMGVFIFVIPSPESLGATILGYLPVTAPFAVPSLYAVGAFGLLDVVIATVGVLVLASLAIRLAGRLYSAALLSSGTLSWRAAFRAEPLDG